MEGGGNRRRGWPPPPPPPPRPPMAPSVVVVESENPTPVRNDRLPTMTPLQRSRSPVWRPGMSPSFSDVLRTSASASSSTGTFPGGGRLAPSTPPSTPPLAPRSFAGAPAPPSPRQRLPSRPQPRGARPKTGVASSIPRPQTSQASRSRINLSSSAQTPAPPPTKSPIPSRAKPLTQPERPQPARGFALLLTEDGGQGEEEPLVPAPSAETLGKRHTLPKSRHGKGSNSVQRPAEPANLSREFRDHLRRRRKPSQSELPPTSSSPSQKAFEDEEVASSVQLSQMSPPPPPAAANVSGESTLKRRSSRRSGKRRRRRSSKELSDTGDKDAELALAAYLANLERDDFQVPISHIPQPSSSSLPSTSLPPFLPLLPSSSSDPDQVEKLAPSEGGEDAEKHAAAEAAEAAVVVGSSWWATQVRARGCCATAAGKCSLGAPPETAHSPSSNSICRHFLTTKLFFFFSNYKKISFFPF
jgi:hypothetical protein